MKSLENGKEENYSIRFTAIERFHELKRIATYKENIYYYPIKKNEETLDSFSVQENHKYLDIYQCTVSKQHAIKTNGLKNIMDQDKNWEQCRIIFVVPEDIYSDFSLSDKTSDIKLKLPVKYSYDRFVLQIPLSITQPQKT